MLKIENHRLVGDNVSFRQSPNCGSDLKARYLILHYAAGRSVASSVDSLCTEKRSGNASAHVVLGRDGSIVQVAPFNVVTWHAGVSQWNGLVGLNQYSIGIEMDNAGVMNRVGSQFVAWFGAVYPDSEVLLAEHKQGGGIRPWHTYTEVQIARALELSELLVTHYGLEDVLGHEDIAPHRKTDPGPAFPLEAVRSRSLGRIEDTPPRYVVTASTLNIRKGPDAGFETVAAPLKRGTELTLLEPSARWSRVEVVGTTDIEGWVNNPFIARASEMTRGSRGQPKSRGARAGKAPSHQPSRAKTAGGKARTKRNKASIR
jgi:N-acetylmuramoyl-L-alanine amidase